MSDGLNNLSRVLGIVAVGGTWIWFAAQSQQRLVFLEAWREQTDLSRFTSADAGQLETRLEADLERLRVELEARINAERSFIRSLCFDVTNLQENAGVSVTNDCARP